MRHIVACDATTTRETGCRHGRHTVQCETACTYCEAVCATVCTHGLTRVRAVFLRGLHESLMCVDQHCALLAKCCEISRAVRGAHSVVRHCGDVWLWYMWFKKKATTALNKAVVALHGYSACAVLVGWWCYQKLALANALCCHLLWHTVLYANAGE